MVDAIRELEGPDRRHLGNRAAEQVDDLLVGMAIAVIDDDPGSKLIVGSCGGLLKDLGDWG
jgi:hypothetical protein